MLILPFLLAAATPDRCEVRAGLDQQALDRAQMEMMRAGLGMVDLSVSAGGDSRPRFAAAWSSRAEIGSTSGAYGQEAFYRASLAPMAQGDRMTGIAVGVIAGAPWFQAIYRRGRTRQQAVEYWIGADALRARLKQRGMIALAISPYRIGRWQYFAVLFEAGGETDGAAAIGLSETALAHRDRKARRAGLVLADLRAYQVRGMQRFVAVWRRPGAAPDRRCRAGDAVN